MWSNLQVPSSWVLKCEECTVEGGKSENRETSKEVMEVVQVGDDGVLDLTVGVERDMKCTLEVE